METKCEEKTLNSFKKDILEKKDHKSLLAVHVNVKNSEKKKSDLEKKLNKVFLLDKGCGPDILCLSETHREKNLPNFKNYERFYGTDEINAYGGVCMYVKSDQIKSEKINDEKYTFNSSHFEHLWVKLTLKASTIVVGAIYRHGQVQKKEKVQKEEKLDKFQEEFFSIIEDLNMKNQRFYILGDFNINFLPKTPCFDYKEKLECQKELDCKSLIDKPTRVCNEEKTKTLIDHIYTSDSGGKSGVVQTDDIADHYPIYCSIPRNDESKKSKRVREPNQQEGFFFYFFIYFFYFIFFYIFFITYTICLVLFKVSSYHNCVILY